MATTYDNWYLECVNPTSPGTFASVTGRTTLGLNTTWTTSTDIDFPLYPLQRTLSTSGSPPTSFEFQRVLPKAELKVSVAGFYITVGDMDLATGNILTGDTLHRWSQSIYVATGTSDLYNLRIFTALYNQSWAVVDPDLWYSATTYPTVGSTYPYGGGSSNGFYFGSYNPTDIFFMMIICGNLAAHSSVTFGFNFASAHMVPAPGAAVIGAEMSSTTSGVIIKPRASNNNYISENIVALDADVHPASAIYDHFDVVDWNSRSLIKSSRYSNGYGGSTRYNLQKDDHTLRDQIPNFCMIG